MTNAIDELDALSNPDLVKKAELENNRPKDLPKFVDIECDIAPGQLEILQGSNQYGDYQYVELKLRNIKVNRCVEGEIFDDDEYDLQVKVPKKANSNSPITLMVASSIKVDKALASIRNWPGIKGAHLVEQVHFWTMNEKAKDEFGEDLKDDNDKQVYLSRQVPTRYYALVGVGGKGGKAAAPAKAKAVVTEEAIAVAKTLIESEEDGMLEKDFNKAAMKNPVLKDMDDILMDGSLITEAIAKGFVVRDGEKLRVTA